MSDTPVLDLEHELPEPKKSWIRTLIGFVIGSLISLAYILADQHVLPDWRWPGFNGLLLLPALYVSIAIHEIGHLVGGRLVGLDSGGIAVGGFVFLKSGKNWIFKFDRRSWAGGFFKPLTPADVASSHQLAWTVAAGPLASLVLTSACLLAFLYSGSGPWNSVGSLFWVALFTVVFSVLPASSGLIRSDGSRLLMLLRRPEQAQSWLALLRLQSQEAQGLEPHEWDPAIFEQALSFDKASNEYPYCQLMAYYRGVDEGSELAALQHLENALVASVGSARALRYVLFVEAASASADIREQAAQARVWRGRALRLRKSEPLYAVEAGIAKCEGRYEEAVRSWEAATARVNKRKLDSGLARFGKAHWAEHIAASRVAAAAVRRDTGVLQTAKDDKQLGAAGL